MARGRNVMRGVAAGMIGGFVASWLMNEFLSKAGGNHGGKTHPNRQAGNSPHVADEEFNGLKRSAQSLNAEIPNQSTVKPGWRDRQKKAPMIHYAFGTFMGGLYGGVAEIAPSVAAGSGTRFGTMLFTGTDLLAVPVLGLSHVDGPSQQDVPRIAAPLAAYFVFGVTTDLVRRILR